MTITLKHLGHFDLPRPQGADERFGWGLAALALTPRGTLWASGKNTRGLVAEVTIPEIEQPAEIVTPWFDPVGGLRPDLKRTKLDRLGGLLERDGWLYSTHYTYYGTGDIDALDVPTLARRGTTFDEGPYHIGPSEHPYHQKATSHWLFESPDGIFCCGRGDGAGNATAPRGPALFSFNPSTPGAAEVLLYRDAAHSPAWWSPDDKWTGAAWLKVGDTERVAFVGSKDLTLEHWYGTGEMPEKRPEWFTPAYVGIDALAWNNEAEWRAAWKEAGIVDQWSASKGYHCLDRAVVLQLYDPATLGPGLYPEPETLVLPGFHEASWVGGMAYDPVAQILYIGEVWPPEKTGSIYAGEESRIHVLAVSAPPTEPEKPPEPPEEYAVRITIEGIGTLDGSGKFVRYRKEA